MDVARSKRAGTATSQQQPRLGSSSRLPRLLDGRGGGVAGIVDLACMGGHRRVQHSSSSGGRQRRSMQAHAIQRRSSKRSSEAGCQHRSNASCKRASAGTVAHESAAAAPSPVQNSLNWALVQAFQPGGAASAAGARRACGSSSGSTRCERQPGAWRQHGDAQSGCISVFLQSSVSAHRWSWTCKGCSTAGWTRRPGTARRKRAARAARQHITRRCASHTTRQSRCAVRLRHAARARAHQAVRCVVCRRPPGRKRCSGTG